MLSASGGTGIGADHSLTITGSLAQVNTDLATLRDTDSTAGADTITVNATDSFGNSAQKQIDCGDSDHGRRSSRRRPGDGGRSARRGRSLA